MAKDLTGVYLCDMGLAKLKERAQQTVTTVNDGPMGTMPYMPPEMFKKCHRGTPVDIYSFGCLVIELYGEKRVWNELAGVEIMQKVCGSYNSPPQMPCTDHLPVAISKFCNLCCQLDAARRPTIHEVLKMLPTIKVASE